MNPIHFTRNRLHVGYLAQDWSDVWYEPDGIKNEDNESGILLYHVVTGGAKAREPMEGEVRWHPHYDPKNCESGTPTERRRLQQRFLTDAYEYLSSKDEEEIEALETKWDKERVDFPRFKGWFRAAKKFKRTQMKRRAGRRRKRAQEARENGVLEQVIEQQVTSDTSDEEKEEDCDSAYGGDIGGDMPPPPTPRKRGSTSSGAGSGGVSKKMRLNKSSSSGNGRYGSTPRMSGALNNGSTGRRSSSRSYHPYEGEEDEDMDIRNPLDQPSPIPGHYNGMWNFDALSRRNSYVSRPGSIGAASLHSLANGGSPPKHRYQATVETDDGESDLDQRALRHEREQSALVMDEDEALEMAIRASREPQSGGDGEGEGVQSGGPAERVNDSGVVVDSIEDQGDETLGGL